LIPIGEEARASYGAPQKPERRKVFPGIHRLYAPARLGSKILSGCRFEAFETAELFGSRPAH
jgi:hypothetical protein